MQFPLCVLQEAHRAEKRAPSKGKESCKGIPSTRTVGVRCDVLDFLFADPCRFLDGKVDLRVCSPAAQEEVREGDAPGPKLLLRRQGDSEGSKGAGGRGPGAGVAKRDEGSGNPNERVRSGHQVRQSLHQLPTLPCHLTI
jgi:hypothetical protein